ncbi:Fanconi anemia group J protein homolog [Salvia hispanica]|uniref:Fanconi anemia group J protein homolog n=1 Tax=Salvia hispanica TaxID=49212 RepID=UPI0020096CC6|nr:Fanconi anemia group J protein homolog [Salvia hispanica]
MEDSTSPSSNPNNLKSTPKSGGRSSTNTIHIGGIPVEFPYKPYGTQLAFMNRVISTLDRSQREGHCHALLESPTGTGKSLSLLCSALAWQQNQKLKNIRNNLTHSSSRADPQAVSDPINHGGGFIPETQPSGNQPPATNAKKEKQRLAPIIFYASRTHAQISQVIREYKKTSYRISMAVLGSRKHYCTNPYLRGDEKVDEQCRLLLKNKEDSCPEYKNVHKVKGHPSLRKGGCHEVHDIEDLVKIGHEVKGCSYFAAHSLAEEAELIFCPYNYIINPVIREGLEVNMRGSIIILDEAHNIEDIARDGGSIDLEEESLLYLQTELGQLSLSDDLTYLPLLEMIQDILSWMDQRKTTLIKRDFQRHFRCWTGDKASKELQEANISLQNFPILQQCAKKAIRIASEAEPDVSHLTAMGSLVLEGLFSSLSYFFSENGIHVHNFELALQRVARKDEGKGGWSNTFSLWCLNPAVVFKSIAESAQSVILTSGTLSPLNTFSSELGVQFDTCLEAPHIIDVDSQVWTAAISTGPGNYPLNASYKTADDYAFQDAVGTSLEEICKVVPGGCLVFFPSYKLLDKLSTRWQETGQWSRLNAQKSIFVEPRGSSQDSFEATLKEYYNYIRHGTRKSKGKKIRGRTLGLKNSNAVESTKDIKKEGASFLAVCRGKVSEGMDFSDDNARAVVIVGIPFPNIYDIKVAQKKKFNDTNELSKNLLSGNEWYCQQAFRALNQAAGRCIRHRYDYGAIIFLDERLQRETNRAYLSKWLRKSLRLYSNFEESLDSLKSFFRDVKLHTGITTTSSQDLVGDSENIKPMDTKMEAKKKNNKVTNSKGYQKKAEVKNASFGEKAARLTQPPLSVSRYDSLSSGTRTEVVIVPDDDDAATCCKYIDIECNSEKQSRSSRTHLVESYADDPELTIVKETPGMNCRGETTTEVYSRDECASPRATQLFSAFPHRTSSHPRSVQNCFSSPTLTCSEVATPELGTSSKVDNQEPEAESRWSANLNFGKRRKINCLSSVSRLHEFSNPEKDCRKFKPSLSTPNSPAVSRISSDHNRDEGLRLFCSHCKNPLGLPENDLLVKCSHISTSKTHLMSLLKKASEPEALTPSSVDVLVSDAPSVHPRVLTSQESACGQGIWCKEDGCVFNSIFCPFCDQSDNCIGVHVVATDELNTQFQNKILFYWDRLEIKKIEAEIKKVAKSEKVSPSHGDSSVVENTSPNVFEKFAYTPSVQASGGWRCPKSRMRLPKKA